MESGIAIEFKSNLHSAKEVVKKNFFFRTCPLTMFGVIDPEKNPQNYFFVDVRKMLGVGG